MPSRASFSIVSCSRDAADFEDEEMKNREEMSSGREKLLAAALNSNSGLSGDHEVDDPLPWFARLSPFLWWSKTRPSNRFLGLAVALLLELCAGTPYAYGAYSSQLKGSLNLSQTEVNTISSVGNVGLYLGIFGGLLYDAKGPTITVFVGAFVSSLGYLLAYLATLFGFASTGVLSACYFIAWQGAGYLDTAAIAVSLKNFEKESGLCIGLVKSFFGLSGSVIAQVYLSLFFVQSSAPSSAGSSSTGVSLGPTLVILFGVASCLGRMIAGYCSDALHKKVSRPMIFSFVLMLTALAQFLFSASPATGDSAAPCPHAHVSGSSKQIPVFLFLSMFVLLIGIIFGPALQQVPKMRPLLKGSVGRKWILVGYGIIVMLSFFLAGTGYLQQIWKAAGTFSSSTHHALSLTFTAVCALAVASLFSMKIAQSGDQRMESDRGQLGEIDPLVADGVSNDQSAVEVGVLAAVQQANFWLLVLSHFCGTGVGLMTVNNLGQIATSLDSSALIYAATLLSGLCYGALWSLVPCIVMDLFGKSSFGANYNAMAFAPAIGSAVMSVGIAAHIYHKNTPQGKTCCIGKACYETTFLIAAGVGVVGAVLTFILSMRTRRLYFN